MDEHHNGDRRVAQEARLVKIEEQTARIVSDAERLLVSFEKLEGTVNSLKNKLFWFSGVIATLVFVSHFLIK